MADSENIALVSKGAVLHSVLGAACHGGVEVDRLLRIDELGYGEEPDKVTQEAGGEPRLLDPARRAAGWNGDSSIYFDSRTTEIIVKLAIESTLSRIGFMDTPWDRNYGRTFMCSVSLTGAEDDWIVFGQCHIERPHITHQACDPSFHPLRNLYVEWEAERGDPPPALFVKYVWPHANDKRIFHLYAFGAPASFSVVTVHIAAEEGGSRVSLTNLGGIQLASLDPVDLESTTLSELRARLAEASDLPSYSMKLVTESGVILERASDQVMLAELLDA